MPKKRNTEIDWPKFLDYSMEQQNIAEFQKIIEDMDGRDLYEMEMICLVNRYLVDRPVNYAFHRTILNYDVEPIDIMRACMVDGQVFLRVEDADHIFIEQYVSRAEWDTFSGELTMIEIKYIYEESNREDYYHIEHYVRNPDGTGTWIVYEPVRGDIPETSWVISYSLDLPYFPYVGIQWVQNQSFLMPLKGAVTQLERAYRVIGAENIERMDLSLYIEGVRNIEDIQTAPRKMGRRVHILPKDAQFHSPNPGSSGANLMLAEIENLHTAIEKASGVVATERLATLSGISRAVAEKPLVMLADELRNRFTAGMVRVEELASTVGSAPELDISYRPIRFIEDKSKELIILDRALETESITPEEYKIEMRLLLDLSPEVGNK